MSTKSILQKQFFLSALLIISCIFANAQETIEFDGTYQGEEIYVQNPYNSETKTYCISKVIINNNALSKDVISSSAFPISFEGYKVGDYVNVKIIHPDGCTPRVLNADALKANSTTELVSIKVEGNTIKWTTKNESSQEPFIVERFKNNKWSPLGKVIGKGAGGFNNYSFEVSHYSGKNRYRIKQRNASRWKFFMPVEHFNDAEPVTFFPQRVKDVLFFSIKAEYEIFDSFGSLVKKGIAENVNLEDIEPGVYYLNIDNRTEKFLKK